MFDGPSLDRSAEAALLALWLLRTEARLAA
jgi:hypothetical protein